MKMILVLIVIVVLVWGALTLVHRKDQSSSGPPASLATIPSVPPSPSGETLPSTPTLPQDLPPAPAVEAEKPAAPELSSLPQPPVRPPDRHRKQH